MHISLRPAVEADREFLFDLHRATMRAYIDKTWGWDEARQQEELDGRRERTLQQVILADGQPVGVLELEHRPSELFISNIQIRPNAQRRGIGTAVISQLLEEGRKSGAAVTLQVLEINEDARRLYERLGFRVTEHTPPHFQMRAWYDR